MLTKVWLCVRPKNLKGCCNLMTSELPFSKRGVTISPFPNGRKLDGTRTNASQKKSFSFSQKHELKNTTLFISLKREFTKTELCSLIVLFILSWASVYLFILYIFFSDPIHCINYVKQERELEYHGHKITSDQNLPKAVARLSGCFWVQGSGELGRPLQSVRFLWDYI